MKQEKIELLLAGLFATLGVITIVFLMLISAKSFGAISDFAEYYAPAKLIFEGRGADGFTIPTLGAAQHLYFPSMDKRIVLLFVPPPGLALFSPIGLLPPSAALVAWKVLLAGSLIAAVGFLSRIFTLTKKQVLYLIAAITLSDACYESLRIDQLAPLLLLGYAAAIYCLERKQDTRAGLWLTLLILKPQQILPFLAFLAGLGRWRPLFVFTGAVAALSAIAYCQLGVDGIHNYLSLVSNPASVEYMQPELTPTFRGQLLRLFPQQSHTIFGATAAIYLAATAFSFILGRMSRNKPDPIMRGVIVITPLAVIASLHCHSYDHLLLVPGLLALFQDRVFVTHPLFKLLLMAGGFAFTIPIAVSIQYDYLLRGGQYNAFFFLLVALVLAILFLAFRKNSTAPAVEQ